MTNKKLKNEIKQLKIHYDNINRLNAIKIANLEDELKETRDLLYTVHWKRNRNELRIETLEEKINDSDFMD